VEGFHQPEHGARYLAANAGQQGQEQLKRREFFGVKLMKRQFFKLLAAFGAAAVLAACGGGSDTPAPAAVATPAGSSIAETAVQTQDLSTLVAAVQFVDEGSNEKLLPLLGNPGNLTVFAPSNAAFDALAVELLGAGKKAADLLTPELKDTVRDIIKYHVLPAKVLKADIPLGQAIATALGGSATFKIEVIDGKVTITDGKGRTSVITATDILANNGVVHLIDKVILPPMPPMPPAAQSIVVIAAATPDLSSLVAALGFASDNNDLVNLLSNTGTFTVFAPTNAAFDALAVELLGAGKTAADLLVPSNKALVRAVLEYHVLGAVVKKADIPLGLPIDPVLAGTDIFKIDLEAGAPVMTDGRNRKSNITATDIMASNGVVHLIDKVILPADKNIVETAASLPQFSILVEAVKAAGLTTTLASPGPFTVFAPTNDAFAALLQELHVTKAQLLANKPLLTAVLTYHVLPDQFLKAQVPIGAPIATAQGGTLTVSSSLVITDARNRTSNIAATDVLTKNGVIHVIDKVILPAASH
jgi:uncharacterized surface protein with fasciclin (FAS1) repeats